ncbi:MULTISPECIES: XRE family transcriptional regulator [Nitrosomonas]|nr:MULTISPECIES: S24 family peptidase [Nitrosomonas]UVS63484.1 helix-turn-helix domain-containing protein [Nitrosomonas sp. PLL12]
MKVKKSLGLNQEQFAEYAGISKSAVSQWENGATTPGLEQLLRLRENLSFSFDELLCDECREPSCLKLTTKKESSKILPFERNVVNISVFSAKGSMGSGEPQSGYETIVGDIKVSKEWVEENLKGITNVRNLAAMTGRGNSMSPTYKDGDILIVDTGVKAVDVDGVYVFTTNGNLFVKRIRKRLDGKLEVSSDNPIVKSYDICDEKDQLNILGLVRLSWNCNKI